MVAQPISQPTTERSWEVRAACANQSAAMTALFFSDEIADISKAKTICAGCPVMAECLESALTNGEQWGVWGGQLFMAGKIVVHKRRRGRPSKLPRPEEQLLVVPFPERLRHLEPV